MSAVLHLLASQPFVLLFVIVALGYVLGRFQVKGIGLGATAATLLCALVISFIAANRYRIMMSIPEFASTVFFNLFMFAVGMRVGPQFVSGLRRDAKKFIALALLTPILAFALIWAFRALVPLGPGFLVGIFAGSNTATPGLGAAQAAFASIAHEVGGAHVAEAGANMSTAFAFAYSISTILFTIMMRVPDMLGANTKGAARSFEAAMKSTMGDAPLPGAGDEFLATTLPTRLPVGIRTYDLEAPEVIGIPLKRLRETYPFVSIERIIRRGRILEMFDDLCLATHDEVTLYGRVERLAVAGPRLGREVYDPVARDFGAQTVDVVVTNEAVIGRKLIELAKDVGHGLFLNEVYRGGVSVPFGVETTVQKGDVLRVTGSEFRIKGLETHLGKVVRPSLTTDVVTLALGLTLGALIGSIAIPIGGIRFAIGSAVGLLLVGVGLSTLRTHYPSFGGPFPEPARELLENLGLGVFVAILGINAGEGVVKAVSQGVIGPIVIGCLVVGFIPPVIAWIVGEKVFKMNTALLLGAVAGGRCSSPGMRAASEVSASSVPAISYPVTFAISNVILTLMSYFLALVR
jgi:putative transport protein